MRSRVRHAGRIRAGVPPNRHRHMEADMRHERQDVPSEQVESSEEAITDLAPEEAEQDEVTGGATDMYLKQQGIQGESAGSPAAVPYKGPLIPGV